MINKPNEYDLNEISKNYLINARTFIELKYMIQDFMDDTEEINPQCGERKDEINYIIKSIEKTMKVVKPEYSEAENNPFAKYDESLQDDFRRWRSIDFMAMLQETHGDIIKANHEFIKDYKKDLARKNIRVASSEQSPLKAKDSAEKQDLKHAVDDVVAETNKADQSKINSKIDAQAIPDDNNVNSKKR